MYMNDQVNLARYNAVILDPVSVWLGPDSPVMALPQSQRVQLANTFTSDLNQALRGSGCRVVRQPGPGVARLQFALVDATTPNAALNTVATYTPYVSTAYSLASIGYNKGAGLFAGTAQVEGYATDTMDGTVLWQAVNKRAGTTLLIKNTLGTQLDIHRAFQDWSGKTVQRLKSLGVCNG